MADGLQGRNEPLGIGLRFADVERQHAAEAVAHLADGNPVAFVGFQAGIAQIGNAGAFGKVPGHGHGVFGHAFRAQGEGFEAAFEQRRRIGVERAADGLAGEPELVVVVLGARDGAGQDATLRERLKQLRNDGAPFSLTIIGPSGRFLEADGRTAGARAVLWITDTTIKGLEESGARARFEEARVAVARLSLIHIPEPTTPY